MDKTSTVTVPRTGEPNTPSQVQASSHPAVLSDSEAGQRVMLLGELHAALDNLGVRCVLARNHRLVLRYNDPPPLLPSGPTDPTLHIFGPAGTLVATTDGTVYRLDDGQEYPASDPAAAAAAIRRAQAAPRQADPAHAR
jgi:hypothetical protein